MGFRTFQFRSGRALLAICAVLLPILGLTLGAAPSRAAEGRPSAPASRLSVYIPLAVRLGKSDTQPPPPPPPPLKNAFFVSKDGKTNTAGAAVDAQGGMHMVFTVFTELANHPPAVYAYCPGPAAACADPNSWQAVGLSDLVGEVQLQLTPAGKPRLLIRKQREGYLQDEYVYAECDDGCTQQSQWRLATIAYAGGTDVFANDNPQHSFALDPQGRPRFVFSNGWGAGYPEGVYYAYCDDGCDNGDNWYATTIYQGPEYRSLSFEYPSLAFTSDGRPRVIANMLLSGADAVGVHYLACDTGCGDISGWSAVRLYDRGGGVSASWSLKLDAQDRPRFAFYQAATDDGAGERLYYAWCDAADCLSAGGWRRTAIGVAPGQGQNADLALDRQGRPRIAYKAADGLGYAWCDAACGTGAQWKRQVVETSAALGQDFPVASPLTCDPAFWTDPIPSLALDPQGNPRIAYDNLAAARCYYQKPGDPNTYSKIEKLWRAVRWLQFPQP